MQKVQFFLSVTWLFINVPSGGFIIVLSCDLKKRCVIDLVKKMYVILDLFNPYIYYIVFNAGSIKKLMVVFQLRGDLIFQMTMMSQGTYPFFFLYVDNAYNSSYFIVCTSKCSFEKYAVFENIYVCISSSVAHIPTVKLFVLFFASSQL